MNDDCCYPVINKHREKEWYDPNFEKPLNEDDVDTIRLGGYDLSLIEEASEQFRQGIMNYPNVIETILEEITKQSDWKYVQPNTFPFYMPKELAEKYFKRDFEVDTRMATKKEYDKRVAYTISTINDALISHPKIVMLYSLDLGEDVGGHWCAMLLDATKNRVEIFDSMSGNNKRGYYTPFFDRLAKMILPSGVKIVHPLCVKESLQETGGFPRNTILIENMKRYGLITDERLLQKLEDANNPISKQVTETQNHFCYMWSIWYIHVRLMNGNLKTAFEIISSHPTYDPLFVIKTYAWNLVHVLGIKQITQNKMFRKHFRSVWCWTCGRLRNYECPDIKQMVSITPTQIPIGDGKNIEFGRYLIDMPKATTLNDCVTASISQLNLIPESKTSPPCKYYFDEPQTSIRRMRSSAKRTRF